MSHSCCLLMAMMPQIVFHANVSKQVNGLYSARSLEESGRVHVSIKQSLRSVSSSLLAVPRTRTNYGDRSFAVYGPRVWNSLPDELRSADITLTTFKNKLKTLLFNVQLLLQRICGILRKCALQICLIIIIIRIIIIIIIKVPIRGMNVHTGIRKILPYSDGILPRYTDLRY